MRKIPVLFERRSDGSLVNQININLKYLFKNPNLRATRKYDGTAIYFSGDTIYGRYCVKNGKQPPEGFIICTYDANTNKSFGWIPVSSEHFSYKEPLREALQITTLEPEKTYELIGEKINNNNEGIKGHMLVEHGVTDVSCDLPPLDEIDKNIDNLKEFLEPYFKKIQYEGIVFWDKEKPLAKLRVKDFKRFNEE